MERTSSKKIIKKQMGNFVITKRQFSHIIAKLFLKVCEDENFFECQINLYQFYEGKGLEHKSDVKITLTNNAINTFSKFLNSSNSFFKSKSLKTEEVVMAEKIRDNKLYVINKKASEKRRYSMLSFILGNDCSTETLEFENKEEIESLQKKLDIIVKRIYLSDIVKDNYKSNNIKINSTNTLLNYDKLIDKSLYEQIFKEKTDKDYDKWTEVYKKIGKIIDVKEN